MCRSTKLKRQNTHHVIFPHSFMLDLELNIGHNHAEIKEEQKINNTWYTKIHQIMASPACLIYKVILCLTYSTIIYTPNIVYIATKKSNKFTIVIVVIGQTRPPSRSGRWSDSHAKVWVNLNKFTIVTILVQSQNISFHQWSLLTMVLGLFIRNLVQI